jgi:hypothetical protein
MNTSISTYSVQLVLYSTIQTTLHLIHDQNNRRQQTATAMMTLFSALLLLLAVSIDARLFGTGHHRSLDGSPCDELAAYIETVWHDSALLEAMKQACDDSKNKDDTFPCQELPLPANTSPINCMSTSECEGFSKAHVCIYTSLGSSATYCLSKEVAKTYGQSVKEMCDSNPIP